MKNMSRILWEMYKEIHMYYEEEFYHVPYPDIQYYVHRLEVKDIKMERLV